MADFTLVPTWVHPEEPEFHNIETQSESMKKEYYNLSTSAVEKFRLVFEGLSDANFKTLRDHYMGRYGGFDSFLWKNSAIPEDIKTLLGLTTNDLTGRWVTGSFKHTPKPHSWEAEITFEREVS